MHAKPSVDTSNIQSSGDLIDAVQKGINEGLAFRFDSFHSAALACKLEKDDYFVIAELCKRAELPDDIKQDYERIGTHCDSLSGEKPELFLLEDPSLEKHQVKGPIDYGGGVYYCGNVPAEQVQETVDTVSQNEDARFVAFITPGISFLPVPMLTVFGVNGGEIDIDKMLENGIAGIGSGIKMQFPLVEDDHRFPILKFLGGDIPNPN